MTTQDAVGDLCVREFDACTFDDGHENLASGPVTAEQDGVGKRLSLPSSIQACNQGM
jgi:hypothetical protein